MIAISTGIGEFQRSDARRASPYQSRFWANMSQMLSGLVGGDDAQPATNSARNATATVIVPLVERSTCSGRLRRNAESAMCPTVVSNVPIAKISMSRGAVACR